MSTTTKKYNENNIKEAAYYCWKNAGCPNGQDEYFWNMAIKQLYGTSCGSKSSCNGSKTSCNSNKTSCCKKSTTTVASASKKSSTSSSKKSTSSKK